MQDLQLALTTTISSIISIDSITNENIKNNTIRTIGN